MGVGNGLDAFRLGLQRLGVGPGDKALVPARTFVASAIAVGGSNCGTALAPIRGESIGEWSAHNRNGILGAFAQTLGHSHLGVWGVLQLNVGTISIDSDLGYRINLDEVMSALSDLEGT